MAVLDFEPADVRSGKTGSEEPEWALRLVPTPKAIRLVKELAPHTFLVGFKLEVGKSREELLAKALELLRLNRCDLIVANDIQEIEAGRHTGYFVDPSGEVVAVAEARRPSPGPLSGWWRSVSHRDRCSASNQRNPSAHCVRGPGTWSRRGPSASEITSVETADEAVWLRYEVVSDARS
jgi:hypothetical protein